MPRKGRQRTSAPTRWRVAADAVKVLGDEPAVVRYQAVVHGLEEHITLALVDILAARRTNARVLEGGLFERQTVLAAILLRTHDLATPAVAELLRSAGEPDIRPWTCRKLSSH
jgi:hypothetical protein